MYSMEVRYIDKCSTFLLYLDVFSSTRMFVYLQLVVLLLSILL